MCNAVSHFYLIRIGGRLNLLPKKEVIQQLTVLFEYLTSLSYSISERLFLGGYLPNLPVEGSVKNLLRNLELTGHSNGIHK